jgi:hypothetical protein
MDYGYLKWLVFGGILTVSAITAAAQEQPAQESAEARRVLVNWFECDECVDGELAAVLQLGERAVPDLIAALESGADDARRSLFERELNERFDRLIRYQADHPNAQVGSDRGAFVRMYLDNFDAQYRVRAATALAEIDGVEARAGLERALRQAVRPDVKGVIEEAMRHPEPGSLQPRER